MENLEWCTGKSNSNKHGEVRKCPACGAMVSAFSTRCSECGFEFNNVEANKSANTLFEKLQALEMEKARELAQHEESKNKQLMERFPMITSLNYIINGKLNDSISDLPFTSWNGVDCVYETMEGLRFKIGPKSFFQTNSVQVHRLYSVVRDFAKLSGNEIVYDLYTGTGTIALFLSAKAKRVVGIEYVNEAIEDAKVNAQINGIDNASFFAGDMKDVLNAEFIEANGTPDVVVQT